jgi:hypothetical protein
MRPPEPHNWQWTTRHIGARNCYSCSKCQEHLCVVNVNGASTWKMRDKYIEPFTGIGKYCQFEPPKPVYKERVIKLREEMRNM